MPQLKSLGGDLAAAITDLIAYYRGLAGDGLSFADGWALIQRALASVLRVLELTSGLSRADKDALAVEAAGDLFDVLAPLIDVPGVPEFVEVRVLDPLARTLVLQLAAGAVAGLVAVFDRIGWGTPLPAGSPAASDPHAPAIPGLAKLTTFTPY